MKHLPEALALLVPLVCIGAVYITYDYYVTRTLHPVTSWVAIITGLIFAIALWAVVI
jgi:hypothetical protein